MSDQYTPTTEQMREDHERGTTYTVHHFDRWLAKVKVEAKAEALEEARDELMAGMPTSPCLDYVSHQLVAGWLRFRAALTRGGAGS